MNIIAQSGAVVNIYPEKITVKTAKRLEKARKNRAERQAAEKKPIYQRWEDHKAEAIRLGDRLIAAGLTKRGWNVKMCGNELIIKKCEDCGNIEILGSRLCRDRLCPLCGWRLAIKRYAAMQSIMSVLYDTYAGCGYSLVTLTCKNCRPEELSATIKKMMAAWTACTYQRWARKALYGWARSLECTYSAERGEIHPHYHILVMHDPHDDTPDKLIAEWLKRCAREGLTAVEAAQHADTIVDSQIKGQSLAGAICETYKYMVKSKDTLSMPLGTLRIFAEQIAGFRLVAFGGAIKRVAQALDKADLESADESDTIMCAKCKSTNVDKMLARWSISGQHYYTMQGLSLADLIDQATDYFDAI